MAHTGIWIDVRQSGRGLLLRKFSLALLNGDTKEISGANLEPPRISE